MRINPLFELGNRCIDARNIFLATLDAPVDDASLFIAIGVPFEGAEKGGSSKSRANIFALLSAGTN